MTTLAPAFLIGLDLGERRDYTAVSVLHQHVLPGSALAQLTHDEWDAPHVTTPHQYRYDLIHLDRWRGKGYSVIPEALRTIIQQLRQTAFNIQTAQGIYASMTNEPTISIVADHTGVGIAVVEEIRQAGIPCYGVMITAGSTVNHEGSDYRVPKRELVSRTQVLLESERLGIAKSLPLAATLEAELGNFRAKKVALTGNDTYGAGADWRDGNHDDLVLSVALAGWFGEHHAQAQVDQLRFQQQVEAAYRADGIQVNWQ